ncbi:GGDEF domain-containing protein [Zoogloea sp.]|uniref:GGDEF domain-containing protein n=1 Tax=Zoogloea sp. TaxID=49181 RepID=UPI00261E75DD|nr:GGDEF domain-containing protein [Zoogloea sp.]MDD3353326.1 GGDEF domain-containing protein [Zoogloea sp.]
MIHVLKHVESITQHRDRTLLELGVASALFELVKAREVNLYKTSEHQDSIYITRVTHVGQDGIRYIKSEFDETEAAWPLTSRPEMRACVEESHIIRRQDPVTGHHIHCFPIGVDHRVLGILEVICSQPLNDEELGTAEGFLGLYRNYLSLLDYSERDTLTGMLNRKTFDENLSKILSGLNGRKAEAAADIRPDQEPERRQDDELRHYWLAVVDVDHFKRINDHFGHLYGDEVLLLLARIMRDAFRHQDRLFRFGGEEFVIILRATSEAEVSRALERLRAKVETYPFPQVGQVTISIGYTQLRITDSIPEIVGRADEALYVAKEQGRNQICHHEALLASGRLALRDKPTSELELF